MMLNMDFIIRLLGDFMDIAGFRFELLLKKDRQIDLADETDALRILAFGRGETLLLGDAPHLGFEQPADGKQRPAELLLRELAEEIALILVGIAACEQLMDRPPVGQRLFRLAAVVARGHVVGAQLQRLAQEYVEFDFAVDVPFRYKRFPRLPQRYFR